MDLTKIFACLRTVFDINIELNNERERQMQIISDCIVELSGISFLKLIQAIRNRDLQEAYNEILGIKRHLTDCFVKSMPVVYKYRSCELDELMDALRMLSSKITFLENYFPLRADIEINTSLCRCMKDCLDILVGFKENLDICNDEAYVNLLVYA